MHNKSPWPTEKGLKQKYTRVFAENEKLGETVSGLYKDPGVDAELALFVFMATLANSRKLKPAHSREIEEKMKGRQWTGMISFIGEKGINSNDWIYEGCPLPRDKQYILTNMGRLSPAAAQYLMDAKHPFISCVFPDNYSAANRHVSKILSKCLRSKDGKFNGNMTLSGAVAQKLAQDAAKRANGNTGAGSAAQKL
ncbi:MAG: hypothetical protein FWF01_00475 [Alphaproteobacteria bacterium]|nr:hypothetical protein [Alphaproteobacteria bacterium]